jgi:hypothetical protein
MRDRDDRSCWSTDAAVQVGNRPVQEGVPSLQYVELDQCSTQNRTRISKSRYLPQPPPAHRLQHQLPSAKQIPAHGIQGFSTLSHPRGSPQHSTALSTSPPSGSRPIPLIPFRIFCARCLQFNSRKSLSFIQESKQSVFSSLRHGGWLCGVPVPGSPATGLRRWDGGWGFRRSRAARRLSATSHPTRRVKRPKPCKFVPLLVTPLESNMGFHTPYRKPFVIKYGGLAYGGEEGMECAESSTPRKPPTCFPCSLSFYSLLPTPCLSAPCLPVPCPLPLPPPYKARAVKL